MEKNQMIFHEFENLITNNRVVLLSCKHDMDKIHLSLEQAVVKSEQCITDLDEEIAELNLQIDALAPKEQQMRTEITELETSGSEISLLYMKNAYESQAAVQLELAAAKARLDSLEKDYAMLQAHSAEMRDHENSAKIVFSNIGMLAGDYELIFEVVDKLQALVQSHNFGFKIIKAQEEERRRVAREIHDGPAQAMANVIFLAEVCERLIEMDHIRAKNELHELRKQVRGCLEETRKIIFDLRPMVLDDLGLIPTVKRIADILRERTGAKVSVKQSGISPEQIDTHVEVSLFRIIQESLNNIEKHAKASEVQVILEFQNDYVSVAISDNGGGFDQVKCHNSDSFGLLGIRERVNLLNGELEISSNRGSGTAISVKIPLQQTSETKQLA